MTLAQINARGYITGYTETDSIFLGSDAANVTSNLMSDWGEAHGRGNHALVGYLTSETDPGWFADKNDYYTKSEVDIMHAGLAG